MTSQAISGDFARVSLYTELRTSQLRSGCLWLLIARSETLCSETS